MANKLDEIPGKSFYPLNGCRPGGLRPLHTLRLIQRYERFQCVSERLCGMALEVLDVVAHLFPVHLQIRQQHGDSHRARFLDRRTPAFEKRRVE